MANATRHLKWVGGEAGGRALPCRVLLVLAKTLYCLYNAAVLSRQPSLTLIIVLWVCEVMSSLLGNTSKGPGHLQLNLKWLDRGDGELIK